MASWREVLNILQNSELFGSALISPDLVKVEVPTQDSRTQLVYIGQVDDKVVFTSPICSLDSINLDALFASDALQSVAYGVAPVGDFLAFKHSQLLDTMDAAELADPIARLAITADVFEKVLTGKDQM